ncbi:MAG: ABC transporter permease subunit [Eggerthellaceae bacterium]|nr:ABC transporter permease subunit [Eggerthellaceae bacterium]
MRKFLKAIVPYLLILPACILLFFFLYGMCNGIIQGFGYLPYLNRTELTPEYYIAALTRPDFVSSIQYSFYLAAVTCAIATIGGVLVSAALVRVKATRTIQLFLLRVPMTTSSLIIALIMMTLFTSTGLVPRVLFAWGIIDDPLAWPSIVGHQSGYGIILVYGWRQVAMVAYFTVTIMMHIGDRYSEAAATLGASPTRTFFSITLPLCRTAILRAALIAFAAVFGGYEIAVLLGPTAPKALSVLAYYEYIDIDLANRSYAMALNGIDAVFCFILAIIYFMAVQRERKLVR